MISSAFGCPRFDESAMIHKIAALYPRASAIIFGFIFGAIYTYFAGLLILPAIELDDLCRSSADLSITYCNLLLRFPLHIFVGALSLWVIYDWTDRWAREYWTKQHALVSITMSAVLILSSVIYAVRYI